MQLGRAKEARRLHVTGVVQGVGFRPFVYRLACERGLGGWVLNGESGVEVHVEGEAAAIDEFASTLRARPPAAALIGTFESERAQVCGFETFEIRESERREAPSVRVCGDLPVCDACLRELFDPADRRYGYPYINCTDCGPRYSIVQGLPYDRPQTTMKTWPMCERCRSEYENPLDRRFHAQPTACHECGPAFVLEERTGCVRGRDAIARAARLMYGGAIVAIKGIGGYHLACDARNAVSVAALRERKYRKERPFAVMVRSVRLARTIVELDERGERLLQSQARPIVLAPAKADFANVAPDNGDLGVMLAYTPVHHLLFASGAPDVLVMTSANRSSEPIAYRDDDARQSLSGIADAFLLGEREIARRVDDSVVRCDPSGPVVLRHARGYAPQAVASIPSSRPIVAMGADLKNAIAVVVRGQAFVSQHIGDLEHYDALESFKATVADLKTLYELPPEGTIVAHDAHPEYRSSEFARKLPGEKRAVPHHRAHIASVLAEREAFDTPVIGFAFDGTGYGEDGEIWG
ncbi:MAG TPA: carbamoyltransferase HypF, partial [Candidatus Baltobacteraceae bacterium]|nr:carbamoyltransferase HypF [Candidatus Baltobacteraceae bacterium]